MHQPSAPIWNPDLIARYDLSGPRYTSYPTAPQFQDDFGESEFAQSVERSNASKKPLSLYFHIPFCSRVCYYCACNKIITADRSVASGYLDRLEREIAMQAKLIDTSRPVKQLHWGGGTPTYLSDDEKGRLMNAIRGSFDLLDDDNGEYAIEIHPGDTTPDSIACLRTLGFNRLSMGIQDFDPLVQKSVNRFNSYAEVQQLVWAARQAGFRSISMDLIYGLPNQSWSSFELTLDMVMTLFPNRLSIFNYAHMPKLFKVQRQIHAADLPSPETKLEIMQRTTERLLSAGYVYIGMDHFARPDDELAHAQIEGKLQRNFQGYATHGDCDLASFGVSAISAMGTSFAQNHKDLPSYYEAIDADRLPIARGLELGDDDLIRAEVIKQLICHFKLSFSQIEKRFAIRFNHYFAKELQRLAPMVLDGLLTIDDEGISVTPAGRLLIRRICMVFDAYIESDSAQIRYSRVI